MREGTGVHRFLRCARWFSAPPLSLATVLPVLRRRRVLRCHLLSSPTIVAFTECSHSLSAPCTRTFVDSEAISSPVPPLPTPPPPPLPPVCFLALVQLNVIFSVIGSPQGPFEWVDRTEMREHLTTLTPISPTALEDLLPGSPPQAIALLQSLLQFKPSRRPSVREAMDHPFFDGMATRCDPVLATRPVDAATIDFEHAENKLPQVSARILAVATLQPPIRLARRVRSARSLASPSRMLTLPEHRHGFVNVLICCTLLSRMQVRRKILGEVKHYASLRHSVGGVGSSSADGDTPAGNFASSEAAAGGVNGQSEGGSDAAAHVLGQGGHGCEGELDEEAPSAKRRRRSSRESSSSATEGAGSSKD